MKYAVAYEYVMGSKQELIIYRTRNGKFEKLTLRYELELEKAYRYGEDVLLVFQDFTLEVKNVWHHTLEEHFPPKGEADILEIIVNGDSNEWEEVDEKEIPKPVAQYLKDDLLYWLEK